MSGENGGGPRAAYSIDTFRSQFSGGEEVFQQVIAIFLNDVPGKLELLTEACREGNRDGAGRLAHSLSNSTGAVRAFRALELSRNLERLAKQGDPAQMKEFAAELSEAIEEVLHVLSQHRQES